MAEEPNDNMPPTDEMPPSGFDNNPPDSGGYSLPTPPEPGQALWLRLPCVFCGAEIPELIEGTTIKCFICNTENSFMESKALLESTCVDVFGKTLSIDFIEDPTLRAEARVMRENRPGRDFLQFRI